MKRRLLIALLSVLSLCSCEKIDPFIDDPSAKERIKAEEIFAFNEPDFDNEKTITIDELNYSFTLSGLRAYASESQVQIGTFWSLYLADVNCDGYRDICYTSNSGSGTMSWYAEVFDVFNQKIIFTKHERLRFDYSFCKKGDYLYLTQHRPNGSLLTDVIFGGGYITYSQDKGVDIEWENYFEISDLETNFYRANDISKKITPTDNCIIFNKNELFMLESKIIGGKNLPEGYLVRNSSIFHELSSNIDYDNHTYRKLCTFTKEGIYDLVIDFSSITKHIKIVVVDVDNTKSIKDYLPWYKDINVEGLESFEYHYWSELSEPLHGKGVISVYRYTDGSSLKKAYDFLDSYVYEVCKELHDLFVIPDNYSNYKYIYSTDSNEYSFEILDYDFLEVDGTFYLTDKILSLGYAGGYIFGYRFASDEKEFYALNLMDNTSTKVDYLEDFIFYKANEADLEAIPESPKFVINFSEKIYVYTPKVFKIESNDNFMFIKFGKDFSDLF